MKQKAEPRYCKVQIQKHNMAPPVNQVLNQVQIWKLQSPLLFFFPRNDCYVSIDAIYNFQHKAWRSENECEGTERAHSRGQCDWQTRETGRRRDRALKNPAEDIIFFLSLSLSLLFPRPEFCYIQSYICSPRLHRSSSWQLVKPPESPSLLLPCTQPAN